MNENTLLRLQKKLQKEQSPERDSSSVAVSPQMGSRRGGARLHPFQSHRWIAFTCAPAADSVLASGDQSEVQAETQQFPYNVLLWMGKTKETDFPNIE